MRAFLVTILLTAIPALTNAELFELSKLETHRPYTFIELSYGNGDGTQLAELFKQIELQKTEVKVRLLGSFSNRTNNELIAFYNNEIPNELKAGIASSGNLHNPSLSPLIQKFQVAFRTTSLFAELEGELREKGYSVSQIEFEKFTINKNSNSKIFVADIWLYANRAPNQAHQRDAHFTRAPVLKRYMYK